MKTYQLYYTDFHREGEYPDSDPVGDKIYCRNQAEAILLITKQHPELAITEMEKDGEHCYFTVVKGDRHACWSLEFIHETTMQAIGNYYLIEIMDNGQRIPDMNVYYSVYADKNDFNSMVQTAEYILVKLFEADCVTSSIRITLRVFNEQEELFSTLEDFQNYCKKHRIEIRLLSNWDTVAYVNDILYEGQIENGMLVKEEIDLPDLGNPELSFLYHVKNVILDVDQQLGELQLTGLQAMTTELLDTLSEKLSVLEMENNPSPYGMCEESGLAINTKEHWEWWLKEKHGLTRADHDAVICENQRCNLDVEYRINYLGQAEDFLLPAEK